MLCYPKSWRVIDMTLKVGIVGCGYISNEHITDWQGIRAKVVAVCDMNISLAEFQAKKYGIPKFYESINPMIKNENLDVVSICTPPQIRSSVIVPFMENGTHVVVEKPFALNVAEASKIIEQQRRYGVKLTVVHCWLFSYAMNKALQILRNGGIGNILGAQVNVLSTPDSIMTSDPHHWAHSLKGGRFAEMIPHPIYLLQRTLGELKVKNVLCSKLGPHSWMPIDELSVMLKGVTGNIGSIYCSFNSPCHEAILRVFGTKAVMDIDLFKQILIVKESIGVKRKQTISSNFKFLASFLKSSFSINFAVLFGKYKGMSNMLIKAVAESLEKGKPLPVTPDEALSVTRIYEDLCNQIDRIQKNKRNGITNLGS